MAMSAPIIEDLDIGSISSDFDVANMTEFDEFTLDEMRRMDAIDREVQLQELEAAVLPVPNPVPLPEPAADVRPRPMAPAAEGPQWRPDNFTERRTPAFLLTPGASVQHPEDTRPAQYFGMFWDEAWWTHLVVETNRYAEQKGAPAAWTPVTVKEMKLFMGIYLAMGVMKLTRLTSYWRQKKRLFRTEFGHFITRDRFLIIFRYLHLADNAAMDAANPDRLAKLRPMINHLDAAFKAAYVPYGDVTIDESMVKFKGRLGFRQYMPAKPIKWGIKVWALCESSTGYMHSFQIYTGREHGQEQGLAHRVVMDLVAPFHNTNLRVAMDNFYTGVPLLRHLHSVGICALGMIRTNRKHLPKDLLPKNTRLQKHEYRVAQADELTYAVWMDTKAVCVLSNYHSPTQTGTVNRRTGQLEQQQVVVPAVLADYQRNMKGVDLCDQMIGYCMPGHRSMKWWRRVFAYLSLVSAHNAYVLAKDMNEDYVNKEWPCFAEFLEDLCEDLVSDACTARAPPILIVAQPCNRLHSLRVRPDRLYKLCHNCKANGLKAKNTNMMCIVCNVPIHQKCLQEHQRRMQR